MEELLPTALMDCTNVSKDANTKVGALIIDTESKVVVHLAGTVYLETCYIHQSVVNVP